MPARPPLSKENNQAKKMIKELCTWCTAPFFEPCNRFLQGVVAEKGATATFEEKQFRHREKLLKRLTNVTRLSDFQYRNIKPARFMMFIHSKRLVFKI